MKKAVILVSGGLDSSTILAMVEKMNFEIYAISFNYGQRHKFELEKVQEFIKSYNIKHHKIIHINPSIFQFSSLVNKNIDLPKYDICEEIEDNIPSSYVPARNTIFLSYALGFAESLGAHDIFIGVHATDHSNYPDCRPEYIKSFQDMANLATKVGVEGNTITIHAPIINISKSEIVKIGLEHGVNYANTSSCYDVNEKGEACGHCLACVVRLEAFKSNKTRDPIKYVEE